MNRQADEMLKGENTYMKKLSSGDVQSLVHELEVHQIELEMQNEELCRVQQELEEARNRYSDLYDFAPLGYFTFDKNGSILEVNLTGAKKLGRDRANLIKKPFSLYIYGNKDTFYSYLQHVINTETQMTCELRLVDNKGNIYDAQLESMPVRDSDGNLVVRTAMSDITGRKWAEEALRKVHDELEIRVQERTAELAKANVELQAEIKERTWAEKRIQHLNNTLRAIRNVNQLITREKDRERLVQESCSLLVENQGWELAWILLVGKDQSFITAASAGADEQFPILVEQMKRGNYPQCVRDTLIQGQPFITCDDVMKKHKGCDMSNCLAGEGAFAARLEHEGKTYGTITISVLPELVLDREEQSLFRELVTDLSYALASIESEEERQRAEKALREASLYTRNLIEASLDPLVTISPEGKITDVNKATELVTGVPREKLIGSDFSYYFIEPEKARKGYQKVFEKGFVRDYPLAIRHVSGSTIDVLYNASVYNDAAGNAAGVFAAARDITERKRMEVALREASLYTRSLIEASLDPLVTISPEGKITDVNKATESVIGVPREKLTGSDFSDYFTEPEKAREGYQKVFEEGFVRDYPLAIRHVSGSTIDVLYNASVYNDTAGNAAGVFAAARDITERKRVEEIQRENEYLTYATKAKSDFLANMSHELRTPLNAVIGFSELLKMKTAGELNEKQQKYISDILMSGKHLLDLINDILDLSKVEAGKIELVIEKVHVPQAINEGLTLVKEKAMKHNISLKVELDPELEFVEVDKRRLKQILFNLLSNAVKFSKPEGGTVTVKTRKEGDMAQISVSDTGIGIREEDMGKLFKEFEQISAGITRKYGGTGLGLSISKKLVDLHGGTIMAESEFGKGSTFTFLLPLKARKEENE